MTDYSWAGYDVFERQDQTSGSSSPCSPSHELSRDADHVEGGAPRLLIAPVTCQAMGNQISEGNTSICGAPYALRMYLAILRSPVVAATLVCAGALHLLLAGPQLSRGTSHRSIVHCRRNNVLQCIFDVQSQASSEMHRRVGVARGVSRRRTTIWQHDQRLALCSRHLQLARTQRAACAGLPRREQRASVPPGAVWSLMLSSGRRQPPFSCARKHFEVAPHFADSLDHGGCDCMHRSQACLAHVLCCLIYSLCCKPYNCRRFLSSPNLKQKLSTTGGKVNSLCRF